MTTTALLWYLLLAASVPVAGVSAVLAWRRRPEPGAEPLAAMLVAVAWWSATYLGELLGPTLAAKLFWARLEWLGSVFIPVAWLLFALEYTGRSEYVDRRTVGVLLVPWAVSNVLVWTNPAHHLVRTPLGLESVNGLLLLDQQYGPWFFVIAAYTYLLVLAGGGLLAALATSSRVLYRGQAVALLSASAVPVVLNAYSVFVSRVDLTPFAFGVTGVAVLLAMSRYELLRATPIAALTASEAVIESMDDGVVVVDTRGHVVRANDAVEGLLGVPKQRVVGGSVEELLPEWDGEDGRQFVRSRSGRSDVVLEVNATHLRNRRGQLVGRTVVLRNVSERHEHTERIQVMNRVLRHNLRNEVGLVVGYLEQLEDELGRRPDEADDIEEAARRLLAIGDRARQAQKYLGREDTECHTRLADVVELASTEARRRHPHATVEVTALPDGPVTCNALLEPVVENLVDNGLRHDPADEPRVEIRAAVEGDTLLVEVADDGPGIPRAERRVLTAGRETPLDHGSGLGLWLVKWCLSQMDGNLSFETPPDGGTVVQVRVPRLSERDDGNGRRSGVTPTR